MVVHAGNSKLAVVGLDLGRAPTNPMMAEIRSALRQQAGIEYVLISGTHTHHGPVIELRDENGLGKDTFPEAVRYNLTLPGKLIQVVLDADAAARSARIGLGSRDDLRLNHNRHSKRRDKVVDRRLSVIRFADTAGNPIAAVVSFAAHPVMTESTDRRWSADYPGHLVRNIEAALGAGCVFMQGAAGDMSTSAAAEHSGPDGYGKHLADKALEVFRSIETSRPEVPSVVG